MGIPPVPLWEKTITGAILINLSLPILKFFHWSLGLLVNIFKLRCTSGPEDYFSQANSEDPDELSHYVAIHLGLHCLPNYSFH